MASIKKASTTLGNTKAKVAKRRDFILTVNEESIKHYDDIKDYFTNRKSLTYYLCVEHVGSPNKHYHILAQFDNSVKLSIKKLFGCHIDVLRGTPQEAYDYIMCKDQKHIDEGVTARVVDETGQLRRRGSVLTANTVKDMSIQELRDIDIRLYKRAKEIKEELYEEELFDQMLDDIDNDCLKGPEVIYVHGEPGQGKTYGAYKHARKFYEKKDIGKIYINNGFFKIVKDFAKCYIVEEFRPSQLPAAEFLQFTDKYTYTASTKGGFKTIKPEMILICSYKHPDSLYKGENNLQFKRRVTKWFKAENKNLIEVKEEDLEDIYIDPDEVGQEL